MDATQEISSSDTDSDRGSIFDSNDEDDYDNNNPNYPPNGFAYAIPPNN